MNATDSTAPTVRLTRKSKSDIVKARSGLSRLSWWAGEMNLPKHNAQKARRNTGISIEAPIWAAVALAGAGW